METGTKYVRVKIKEIAIDFEKSTEDIVCDGCFYDGKCQSIKSPQESSKTFQEWCCKLEAKLPNHMPKKGSLEKVLGIKEMTDIECIEQWVREAKKRGMMVVLKDAYCTGMDISKDPLYIICRDNNGETRRIKIDETLTDEMRQRGIFWFFEDGSVEGEYIRITWK